MTRKQVITLLASGGGLGFAPVASGTFGSLGGLVLLPVVAAAGELAPLVTVGFVWIAVRIADEAEQIFGEKDSGRIVVDEIAGFLVTMLFVPIGVATVAAGFFFFRLFDVLKPWPGSHFDRNVRGGFGVVMDDVVAGVYANLVVQIGLAFGWLG